jgi:hypothetical protein
MSQLKSDLITAAGAAMLVGSAVCAELAWLAARGAANLGVICGSPGQIDCPYLVSAAGLLLGGSLTLTLGLQGPKAAHVSATH